MSILEGTCHCGAVRWRHDGQPPDATVCNCSICRRQGTFWAYDFEGERITVEGPTSTYVWGETPFLAYHFCPTCGCVAYWRALQPGWDGRRRIAVSLRLADPAAVAAIPLDLFDGADTFTDLPRDGRCVGDLWFR